MKSEEIAERIKGKLALVYGSPGAGKTVLGLAVSRHFATPYLILVDTNYPPEYYKINPNIKVIEAHNMRRIYNVLERLPQDADYIMVDSITSIASEVVGEQLLSPRKNLLLSNFYDWCFRKLARAKGRATVLVIAHERLEDFERGTIGPRLNKIALRHVDVAFRLVAEDGKRRLIKTFDRGGKKTLTLDWEVVE